MKKIWAFFLLLCAGCLAGCGKEPQDIVAEGSVLTAVGSSWSQAEEIYDSQWQDQIKGQLEELKKKDYDLTAPLVAVNPYGTCTNGLYVYFCTEEEAQISYRVQTEGYDDFERTLYNGGEDGFATEHEYLLIGSIPGMENTVCLRAEDKNGDSLGSYTFTWTAPDLLNATADVKAVTIKGTSQQELSDGLYTILGNDTSEESQEPDYVGIYDNKGVARGEIPIIGFRSHEMIFHETGMYFSISNHQMARMEPNGYISRIYDTGDHTLHHDYLFGTKNDLLILASSRDAETKDDKIISIDLESGQVTEVVDLGKLFPEYLKQSVKPENAKVLDWMHLNSMALVDGKDLIVSARETSTIIYLEDVYGKTKVRYMIGSPDFWKGSGYENLLLKPEGDFSLQAGQHSVLYVPDDSLPEGQYYLEMFNNNNTYSLARKEYDWSADSFYHDTGEAVESRGNPSYYYKYLVDEKKKTAALVDSLPVDYSGFVSSVQQYGGNLLCASGQTMSVSEYDSSKELIQKLQFTGEKWIYRIKKYDYNNYWFSQDSN